VGVVGHLKEKLKKYPTKGVVGYNKSKKIIISHMGRLWDCRKSQKVG